MSNYRDIGEVLLEQRERNKLRDTLRHEVPHLAHELNVESCVDFSKLICDLCEIAIAPSKIHRREAIRALGILARDTRSLTDQTKTCLFRLLKDEDAETRLSAVQSLWRIAPIFSQQIVQEIMETSFGDTSESVVATLDVIGDCDATCAVQAVPAIMKLIGPSNDAVRQAACKTLGKLESLSAEAIPALIEIAAGDADVIEELTRAAAATAICQIDPPGQLVCSSASDLRDLVRLRDLIAGLGVVRQPIVKNLTSMIAQLADGPAIGRRRMQLRDVVVYIFGSFNASQERSLRNWIKARKLRAISIRQGLYDVDIGDLEMLRHRRQGNTTEETN